MPSPIFESLVMKPENMETRMSSWLGTQHCSSFKFRFVADQHVSIAQGEFMSKLQVSHMGVYQIIA